MASSFFEIVQLPNGDFALQPMGGGSEHLVKISFGQEAKAYLAENDAAVAHAMINAAIKLVGDMREEAIRQSEAEEKPKTVH
ncbi:MULTISPECIES: hypothetical protein [Hahella]|uniref:Uncharacterized protein n=1 Tax=Hahella chejuensis (strain KCTC 2396) TaxID=349521 RepID=Q2SKC6_HAHCH|nr:MULTISPECIES: hypothetical protein [Hahella]ABC28898.1 hypothetical protein HCH_02067 [Hahella chejuensis KCTC 2396]MBU6952478.1 hypothetical protein [Hahella sp. HN01]MDG9671692.1 hypothetical protein [Hahella sp. CR1]WLQ11273.1 hypothetical protein O5O45_16125 [Hahella sp. HNIBRBA332]